MAKKVLLVAPRNFRNNPETMSDNVFMKEALPAEDLQSRAMAEFNNLCRLLEASGIETLQLLQDDELDTPDAVFPNNWFSTHPGNRLVIYPMKALSRRHERRPQFIRQLTQLYPDVLDLSPNETRGLYLEGTGSVVIDHDRRIAYASLSERTSSNLLYEWGKKMNHEVVLFSCYDKDNRSIYHTNVVLSIGRRFAIYCPEIIHNRDEREQVEARLRETGHELIPVTYDQMSKFCCNCLELQNDKDENILLMSSRAHDAFTDDQRRKLSAYARIIHCALDTFETYGGGSARCMVAEMC